MKLLAKKIPTLLAILVLIGGVFAGIWYVNSKRLDAGGEGQPINVRITNVADNKFTVSWKTEVATIGKVMYGVVGEKLTNEAVDDRDALGEATGSFLTHHVTVADLQPNVAYGFRIISGNDKTLYDNNGSPYSVTTGPTITETPPAETVYGQIEQSSTLPAEGVLVYLSIPNGAPASVLSNSTGAYTFPISVLRTNDLKKYLEYDRAATVFTILAEQGKQQATANVSTANAAPVPLITLGKTYDFVTGAETKTADDAPDIALVNPATSPSLSPEPSPTFQSQAETVFNVEPLGGSLTSQVLITNPASEGEILATSTPEFRGSGPKNTVLSIVVQSAKKVYRDTIAITEKGSWAWAASTPLANETHTISVAYIDVSGVEQKIKRSFSVNSVLADSTPAFVSTPSASLRASASPSATPRASAVASLLPSPIPSPSIRAAVPATDSGIPVTGVIENTVLTAVFATVIMVTGALLLAL